MIGTPQPMARPLISPDVLARRDALRQSFAGAQPFRHIVVDDFLAPGVGEQLLAEFPPFDERRAVNENKQVAGKATFENIRRLSPGYAALDDYLQTADFLEFVGNVTGIDDLLYDPLYYGGGTHENRHGQELDPHIDFNFHPKYGWHRRLNLIVYLNDQWQDEWGGAIELHDDPRSQDDKSVVVAPRLNRCVLFETTEHSWHGFQKIDLPESERQRSRRSFAIYLYSTERPAELTAPEHHTVYVDRRLAVELEPGHVLTEAECAEIDRNIARRDDHLERLYRRELRFTETIANLREQLDARSPLRRMLRSMGQKLRPLLYRTRRRLTKG